MSFDKCIKEAIRLGRKYMRNIHKDAPNPTKQEWELAVMLYNRELNKGGEDGR